MHGRTCNIPRVISSRTELCKLFFIERDNLLEDVCKSVTDSILLRKEITEWPREENNFLKKLGENLKGNVPTFENTKSLGSWVNAMAKTVKQVVFVRCSLIKQQSSS